jgi:hypothetical protein
MAVFTAYLPPDGNAGDTRFIADRPSLLALVFPPVFLVWHRLWWPLVLYVLVTILLMAIGATVSEGLSAALGLLPGFFLFVHGRDLVRDSLLARGWHETTSIAAASAAEAELRFFHRDAAAALATKPPPPLPQQAFQRPALPTQHQSGSLGIFPQ